MKTIKTTLIALLLVLSVLICLAGCNTEEKPTEPEANVTEEGGEIAASGLWTSAKYRKDTELGEGKKTVSVDIEAEGKEITVTLKTDAATLGQALYNEGLINDASFFNVCNGIKADWDADNAYWGFYVGSEYAMVGVNDTEISGGEHYRFVYTK